ncbi:LytTR family transcriptional regulator DNA-binding domain-containing protein [Paenibacillus gansuensis]|uniref:LytTR family transcriptional regulator DNA-binding domain-containing protein n=1 Tax=Paenibacillus gansuensis TaxID=306542 RepID=A0ABW5PGQ0_9BACL
MRMPVVKRVDSETNELVMLDLNEVLFINIESRNIVYHTSQGKFYQITTLSELSEHLQDQGFDTLDKTNLVNMNKIKNLDSKYGKLYFEENPAPGSPYASVSAFQQKIKKNEILRAIAANNNKSLEYTVKDAKVNYKLSSMQSSDY